MIKAVLFDFDGVIHDSIKITYDINRRVIPELTLDEYKDFFNGNLYANKKVTREASEQYFKLQHDIYKTLKVEEDIKSELHSLNKNHDLFIVSSNIEHTMNVYFRNNNIMVFREVLGTNTHKSKKEKIKMIIDKYKYDSDECIFVTDTLGDIIEANEAGIKTIAVDFGFHDRERLKKGNPVVIVSHFRDIRKFITGKFEIA
ncbi:HAD hydrolase-like protein [Candidatus Woesearchaeota archaeon]|nr:HAD hydrolase-like protein [Candidatus Woesearchaeota archaeon]